MPRDRKHERYEDERSRRRYDRSPEQCCDTETQTESSSHVYNKYNRREESRRIENDSYEKSSNRRREKEKSSKDVLDPYTASGRMIVIASPSRKMLQRLASVTTSDTEKYVVRKAKKNRREHSLSPSRHTKRNRSLSPDYKSSERRKQKKDRNYSPNHRSEKRNSKRGRSRSPEYNSPGRRKSKRERSKSPEKRRGKSDKHKHAQSLSPVEKSKRKKKRSRSYTPEVSEKSNKFSPQNELKKYILSEKIQRTSKNPKPLEKSRSPAANECPLCLRQYEFPILLRCAHTFCKDCVTVLVESSDGVAFKCPICETEIPLSGGDEELFCPNFVVLQNIGYQDEIDDVICSACKHEREADFYCEDCVDLLCYECADAHQVVKYTKDHIVKKITAETNLAKYIKKRYFCTQHENMQLQSHCMTCENSICKQCVKESHSGPGHDCLKINNAAKIGREEMQRQLYSLKKYMPSLEIALMDVKRAKKLLLEQTEAVRTEISDSIKRLIKVLQDRETALMLEVDKLYKTKIDQFKQQKQNILVELEQYECASRVLIQLEKHDNSVELLQMKSTIDKALKNLQQFKSDIKVSSKTFFLKSNEVRIKKAISKHGEIESEFKTSLKKSINKTSPIGKISKKNPLTYIISSDFEENAQNDGKSNESETSARKLRTQANWMIVKSRVPDIIQFGVSNGYIEESQTSSLRSDHSLLNFNRLEQAKRIRARANWHLLISKFKATPKKNEIKERKISPKKAKSTAASRKRKNGTYTKPATKSVCDALLSSSKSKRKIALRNRASANWLLVRSRLNDIVDYGKITGIIPHQFTAWSSAFLKKKSSKTILKLKRYRAIALRARANWLLVSARLKDIIQYPRNKSLPFYNRFSIHDSLLLNRAKAARNKQIAGEVRAKANWLIVRTRLTDIVLYGKYLSYQQTQQYEQAKYSTPPIAPRDQYSKSQSKSTNQKHKKTTSAPGRSTEESSKQQWHVLVHQGDYSPVVKRIEFDREKSRKNWDRLIADSETTRQSDEARNNWDILIRNTTKNDGLKTSSKGLSKSLESINLSSYSENSSSSKTTVVANWDRLISGTNAKNMKEKKWDKIIDGSSFMKNAVTFSDDKVTLRKSRKSYSYDDISKKYDTEDDESMGHWKELIKGTKANFTAKKPFEKVNKSGPVNAKNTDQVIKNWHALIQQTKINKELKQNFESMKNWSELVKNTDADYEESSQSEQFISANQHWDDLVHGTVATFSTTDTVDKSVSESQRTETPSQDSILNPKQEKALALWSKLISETFVDAERKLKKDEMARAYRNWDRLMIQTKISNEIQDAHKESKVHKQKKEKVKESKLSKEKESKKSKSKDEKDKKKDAKNKKDSKVKRASSKEKLALAEETPRRSSQSPNLEEALDNWFILIRGTEESTAFKDWEFLIDNTENDRSEGMDSSRLSARSLRNILKGGLKRKSITSVLEGLFRKSKSKEKSKANSTLDSEEFPENTEMAGTSTNDVIENWHALINDTAIDKKAIDNKEKKIDKEKATENWVKLIDSQPVKRSASRESQKKVEIEKPGTSHSNRDIDDITAATEEADLISAIENWQKLVINTDGSIEEKTYVKPDVIKSRTASATSKRKDATTENETEHNEEEALKHWNNLINGVLSSDEMKALKHWEILTEGRILKKRSSLDLSTKMDDPKSAWSTLIRGTSVKSGENEAMDHWHDLIADTEISEIEDKIKKTRSKQNDQVVSPRQGTQSPGRDRTHQQALHHWDKLIEGKITRKSANTASPLLRKSDKSSEKTKTSVFRNWNKALAKTPPLPRQLKAITSKPKKEALENWNKITSDLSFSREDIALENWKNLTRGENPYEHYLDKRPPAGANILLEKKRVTHENQTRLLNMKVRNSKGDFNDIQLKLSSPDKSILSAHIAENKDGTFTIFCCPRIDNDFNMFVSLYGDGFTHEIKVLNFYGSFAGIKKQEAELACRTISLIRWHLTPGLLVKKGNKVVAGRSDM